MSENHTIKVYKCLTQSHKEHKEENLVALWLGVSPMA